MSDINRNDLYTNVVNSTTVGTPINLASQWIPGNYTVTLKARNTNTGRVKLGRSSAVITGGTGYTLGANEVVNLRLNNLNNIWMDVTVAGEGIEIIVEA